MTITPAEFEVIGQHPMVDKCILTSPVDLRNERDAVGVYATNNPCFYVMLKPGFCFEHGVVEEKDFRERSFKNYNDFLLAVPVHDMSYDQGDQSTSTPDDVKAGSLLSDEQCAAFRSMPGTFNDMVRAIYQSGHAKGASETVAKLHPFVQDVSEQLGAEECNNCDLAEDAAGNLEEEMDQLSLVSSLKP